MNGGKRKMLLLKIVDEVEVDGPIMHERITFKKAVQLEPGDYLVHAVWDSERGSRVTESIRIYGLIADVEGLDERMLGRETVSA